jgi:hypothetical protein
MLLYPPGMASFPIWYSATFELLSRTASARSPHKYGKSLLLQHPFLILSTSLSPSIPLSFPSHNSTNNTTIALNLALSKRVLTVQNIIQGKLQGDKCLKDNEIAEIVGRATRTVRQIRSNLLLFRSITAPSNSAGRTKTVAPPILTALYAL